MPTPIPCFQLDVRIDQALDSALSTVISRVHANNGDLLHMESFSEDVAILYVSIQRISYGVFSSMLGRVARVTEKPLSPAALTARSTSGSSLTGQLLISAKSEPAFA